MIPEQELLIALLRQQNKSHLALMRAVLALSTHLQLLSINFENGVKPTEADKQKWQELRGEFQKHLERSIAALAELTEEPS